MQKLLHARLHKEVHFSTESDCLSNTQICTSVHIHTHAKMYSCTHKFTTVHFLKIIDSFKLKKSVKQHNKLQCVKLHFRTSRGSSSPMLLCLNDVQLLVIAFEKKLFYTCSVFCYLLLLDI